MRARRALGLQGWLVAALLAVGLAASLAVLLVVLPTLESSVRTDRAKREAQELHAQLLEVGKEGLPFGATGQAAERVAEDVGNATGADVKIDFPNPGDVFQSSRVIVRRCTSWYRLPANSCARRHPSSTKKRPRPLANCSR